VKGDIMIPQLSKLFKGIGSSSDKPTLTTEERIELNKTKFNLSHGKGLRKKHKGKKKKSK
jgi:hypothetical protein